MRLGSYLVMLLASVAASPTAAAPQRFQLERGQAEQAITALRRTSSATVVWPPHRSRPSMFRNLSVAVVGSTDLERARRFLALYPALFAAAGAELRHVDTQATHDLRAVRFQQHVRGLPVEGAIVVVAIDAAGRVRAVTSEATTGFDQLPARPSISPLAAVKAAVRAEGGRAASARADWARLVVLGGVVPHLAYKINAAPAAFDLRARVLYVDAVSGEYLGSKAATIVDGPELPRRGVRP
jgi:hypothetical protein